jgi:hypothetical protein
MVLFLIFDHFFHVRAYFEAFRFILFFKINLFITFQLILKNFQHLLLNLISEIDFKHFVLLFIIFIGLVYLFVMYIFQLFI